MSEDNHFSEVFEKSIIFCVDENLCIIAASSACLQEFNFGVTGKTDIRLNRVIGETQAETIASIIDFGGGETLLRIKKGEEYSAYHARVWRSKNTGERKQYFIDLRCVDTIASGYAEQQIFAKAVDASGFGIMITDLSGCVCYVNPQFTRNCGYELTELEGRKPSVLKSGTMPNDFYKNLWKTILAGRRWKGEIENRKKNGELFWQIMSVSPIYDHTGVITHFVAMYEDISERKMVYQHLFESEERLRFMLDATGDVLYRFRFEEMEFEYLNSAIVKLTGYTAAEINEIRLPNLIERVELAGNDLPEAGNYSWKRTYGEKGDYRADYLIRTKSGQYKWIEDHSYPWYDEKGMLVGSVGILTDITDRKAIEMELVKARDQAREMNNLKNTFLANMSHELRTPMISILGYSDMLKDMAPDKEIFEIAEIINNGAKRLTDTINLILDLSALEANQVKVQYSDVDIREVLTPEVNSYRKIAADRNLYLHYSEPKEPVVAAGDQRLLKQVFSNVLNNAIKYTVTGGVEVKIMNQKDDVLISFKDTGIGIKKEDFELIFQDFRQASEGLGRKYEGSGLGLSISKKFLEKLGGKIWLESTPGKGSTFFISIPKRRKEETKQRRRK